MNTPATKQDLEQTLAAIRRDLAILKWGTAIALVGAVVQLLLA